MTPGTPFTLLLLHARLLVVRLAMPILIKRMSA
ncbi:hypothetical protein IFHNHDMJ_02160 [Synechococcus sp. CBW1107]|nr:hypothetical protein IFHNHDMJ_02160 [Synechococcus sp. CBW1107]